MIKTTSVLPSRQDFLAVQPPLIQLQRAKWQAFFIALNVPIQLCHERVSARIAVDFWLPREQVWLVVDEEWNSPELGAVKPFADETGCPVLFLRGEPQPGKYSVLQQPPRRHRQLYLKMSRAIFVEGRKLDKRLWLLERNRYMRVGKINHISQLKGARPRLSSDWLAQAFECVREQFASTESESKRWQTMQDA